VPESVITRPPPGGRRWYQQHRLRRPWPLFLPLFTPAQAKPLATPQAL